MKKYVLLNNIDIIKKGGTILVVNNNNGDLIEASMQMVGLLGFLENEKSLEELENFFRQEGELELANKLAHEAVDTLLSLEIIKEV